jgi:hypothetical protein
MSVHKADDRVLHRGVTRDYKAPKGQQWCVTYEYRDGYLILGRFKTKAEAFQYLHTKGV